MAKTGPNPYLRTKVMTASPVELRAMLLDGAIRFLEQAKDGLERKDHEAAFNGFTRCQAIVIELLNGLDPEQAPDLCEKLSSLYTFLYTRLVTACTARDTQVADEVLGLLRYERETWSMLQDRLARENAAGAAAAAEVASDAAGIAPGAPAPSSSAAAGLVGAQVSLRG